MQLRWVDYEWKLHDDWVHGWPEPVWKGSLHDSVWWRQRGLRVRAKTDGRLSLLARRQTAMHHRGWRTGFEDLCGASHCARDVLGNLHLEFQLASVEIVPV